MVYTPIWVDPVANLSQLIWPALATGYRYSAVATRMTRSTVLEVLREDYIRTARAKGLWEKLILLRHALKNAMLPVLTVIGLEFAFLIGGLVVTEQVFNLIPIEEVVFPLLAQAAVCIPCLPGMRNLLPVLKQYSLTQNSLGVLILR